MKIPPESIGGERENPRMCCGRKIVKTFEMMRSTGRLANMKHTRLKIYDALE